MTIDLDALAALAEKAYEITPEGIVFSATSNWRGYGRRPLVQTPNSYGYPSVRVMIEGRRVHLTVHRLVAAKFLPKRPSPKHEIRHLDGNKENSSYTNLCWGTAKENADDRDRHGRTARGSANGFSKLSENEVVSIKSEIAAGRSQRTIAARYNVSQGAIAQIARGKTWRHV